MSIKRVAARIALRELADIFGTPTIIVNTLVARGMGYRNQVMFNDANNAIGWAKHRRTLAEAVGPPVGFRETIDSWDMDYDRRYKVYGTSIWRDNETGQLMKKSSSMYTDTLWEDDEDIAHEFEDLFADDQEKYKGRTFVGFEINGIEKNVDMPHLKLSHL